MEEQCPECGYFPGFRLDGAFKSHRWIGPAAIDNGKFRTRCPGGGKPARGPVTAAVTGGMQDQTGPMTLADAVGELDELLAQPGRVRRLGKENAGAIKTLTDAARAKIGATPAVTEHRHDWRRVCQECGATEAETSPVTARICACGCGQPVTSPRPEAKYATGACRVRAHRAG